MKATPLSESQTERLLNLGYQLQTTWSGEIWRFVKGCKPEMRRPGEAWFNVWPLPTH